MADAGTAATSNTMQVMFASNGDVEFRWGTMSLALGGTNPCIVGWTPGGGVMDSDLVDISALTTSFNTGPTDNPPLALALGSRPKLGTTVTFTTSNIPTGTAAGAFVLSATQLSPGLDLGFVSMPQCFANVNLASTVNFNFAVAGASAGINLPIPTTPFLAGVLVFGQSITITPGYNPLGVLTSNGVRVLLGSF